MRGSRSAAAPKPERAGLLAVVQEQNTADRLQEICRDMQLDDELVIADTLDAVTSDRAYQRASSFESAREIIRRLSGTAFDPQVVAVFLNIREDVWPTIAKHQRQIAGLSPEMRRNPAMVLPGLGPIR